MSDAGQRPGLHDRARIDIHQPQDLRHWTHALGLPKERLAAAVRAVGASVDRVRAHLGLRGPRP